MCNNHYFICKFWVKSPFVVGSPQKTNKKWPRHLSCTLTGGLTVPLVSQAIDIMPGPEVQFAHATLLFLFCGFLNIGKTKWGRGGKRYLLFHIYGPTTLNK